MPSQSDSLPESFMTDVRAGAFHRVQEAIKADPSLACRSDRLGCTALMEAAYYNQYRIVEALLPWSEANAQNKGGWTALMRAVLQRDPKMIQLLLPHSDPDRQGEYGLTALRIAVDHSNFAAAQLLAGCSNPNVAAMDGRSILSRAVEGGSVAVVKDLLPRCNWTQQNKDKDRGVLLSLAANTGDVEMVALVWEWTPAEDKHSHATQAWLVAQREQQWGCVDFLLARLNPSSEQLRSTLQAAKKHGGLDQLARCQALLERGLLAEDLATPLSTPTGETMPYRSGGQDPGTNPPGAKKSNARARRTVRV